MSDNSKTRTDSQIRDDRNTACTWAMIGGGLLMLTPAAPFGFALIGQSVATMACGVGIDAAQHAHNAKYGD